MYTWLLRFEDFDIDGDGNLGRKEFRRALNLALAGEIGGDSKSSSGFTVSDIISEDEAVALMSRLDKNRNGGVCWEVRCRFIVVVVVVAVPNSVHDVCSKVHIPPLSPPSS